MHLLASNKMLRGLPSRSRAVGTRLPYSIRLAVGVLAMGVPSMSDAKLHTYHFFCASQHHRQAVNARCGSEFVTSPCIFRVSVNDFWGRKTSCGRICLDLEKRTRAGRWAKNCAKEFFQLQIELYDHGVGAGSQAKSGADIILDSM